ncbi:unnamed protein product [Haemonchus placei]|uniref:Uncharacterized protein n=1 Tax=Haemonchus placei TaxID=6290 RepID=A0A0N4X5K8_HAEPC|nr:unnamed protein product [Haemonchus placei]
MLEERRHLASYPATRMGCLARLLSKSWRASRFVSTPSSHSCSRDPLTIAESEDTIRFLKKEESLFSNLVVFPLVHHNYRLKSVLAGDSISHSR